MIPVEFIHELKNKINIVEIIDELLPAGSSLERKGQSYKVICPFHNEKTPSFVVTPSKNRWHCFGACNIGGDIIEFVLRIRPAMNFRDVIVYLARKAKMELPNETRPSSGDIKKTQLYKITGTAANAFHSSLLKSHKAVMAKAYIMGERQLSLGTIKKFMIGWSPKAHHDLLNALIGKGYEHEDIIDAGLAVLTDAGTLADRFRDRIMFPIRDKRGDVLGFGGRIYHGGSPKYTNSPSGYLFDKSRILYGIYEADASQAARYGVFIVEGYLDVIAMHEMGIGNVLGIMGTAITTHQAKKIARISNNIFLVLDGDKAGVGSAIKAIKVFDNYDRDLRVSVVVLPDGDDPYSIMFEKNEDVWKKLVEKSVTGIEFIAKFYGESIKTPEDASSAMDAILPLLSVKRASVLDQYVSLVAKFLKVSPDTIKRELADFNIPNKESTENAIVTNPNFTTEQYILALIDMFPSLSVFSMGLSKNDFTDSMNRSTFIALTSWGTDKGSAEDEYIKRIRKLVGDANIRIKEKGSEGELKRVVIKHKEEQVNILASIVTDRGVCSDEEMARIAEEILSLKSEITSIREGRVNEAPF